MLNLPTGGKRSTGIGPACSPPDGHDDPVWRYRFIKAMSNSPVRVDMERCLVALDELIRHVRSAHDPARAALVLEMDDRRRQVLAALRFGSEI